MLFLWSVCSNMKWHSASTQSFFQAVHVHSAGVLCIALCTLLTRWQGCGFITRDTQYTASLPRTHARTRMSRRYKRACVSMHWFARGPLMSLLWSWYCTG